jgi:hypothetical protein
MKLLTWTSLILTFAIPMGSAVAGSECRTNQWGTTTCTTGQGHSTYGGTTYTGRTNQWGTTTWTGSNGSYTTCRTNQWGTTSCN